MRVLVRINLSNSSRELYFYPGKLSYIIQLTWIFPNQPYYCRRYREQVRYGTGISGGGARSTGNLITQWTDGNFRVRACVCEMDVAHRGWDAPRRPRPTNENRQVDGGG